MSSWVYLFSQFTPEALLFESLSIFILAGGYASFWVLRKRRMGSVTEAVPIGIVKTYLNELIIDAEQMRVQLFGLLQSAGVPLDPSQLAALRAPRKDFEAMYAQANGATPDGGDGSAKISALETKMAQQAEAMQTLMLEKTRIERELAQAKTATQTAGAASAPGDSKVMADLQTKIGNLEGKLAEYSVIEDDLANLKKLQQENAQLKAALAQGGAATAPVPASVAAPMVETASAVPDAFEGLVDQVEQSLQQAPVQQPSPIDTVASEKTDADLVAEFEKMLNS